MVNKLDIKQHKVTLTITSGPVTPAIEKAWRVWWARLVASVREELDKEEKSDHALSKDTERG